MDNLISERVWQDDGFFEIKVTAQSNHAQAATCSYTTNDSIKDLSDRLSVFPLSSTDEYLWQNGTRGDGHTPCVELRFFCKDKLGHIRIEAHLEIDDGGSLDNHHCSFYLSTEPQILNSFGKSLLALNNPITGTKVELNEQLSRSTMSEPNSCYTYFKITGDFDPDDITHLLALSPEKQWRVGDLRRNGTVYDFAMWEYGRCEDYDILVENQMLRTIDHLIPKISILQEIKKNYDVYFTLEIVPSIHTEESTPCLAPNRAVIEFCYLTETNIDIDLYVFYPEDDK